MYKWRKFFDYFPSEDNETYVPAGNNMQIPHSRINFYEIPRPSSWNPLRFKAAEYALREIILPHCSNTSVLPVEEILDVMDLSKSNGLIWSQKVRDIEGKPTKKILFDTYPDLLPYWWEQAAEGKYPLTMQSSHLKQELLLKTKARAMKGDHQVSVGTRLFIPNDPLNLAVHQGVSNMFNKLMYHEATYPATMSALGWCKFYGNANRLFLDLPEYVIMGDLSQQDSSLNPALLWSSAETIRLSWKVTHDTTGNRRRLAAVYANIIYPMVCLPDGSVYKKRRGNCSGQLRTSGDNTYSTCLIVCYDLLKNGYNPLDHLNSFLAIVNGDDSYVNPDFTTVESLRKSFGDFGQIFKGEYLRKEESSFCSHVWTTLKDSNGYDKHVMVLPRERITCALLWSKSQPKYKLVCERLAGLSIEAYPYPDLFDKIRDALDDLNAPSCYVLTRQQLNGLWLGIEDSFSIPEWVKAWCKIDLVSLNCSQILNSHNEEFTQ